MIRYANKNAEESERIFINSSIINNLKIKNYNDVIFYSHELEYHWAMLLVYGEQYWLKGISSDEPNDYFEWETQYRKEHNLAEGNFVFGE